MSKKKYIYRDLVGRLAQLINAELLGLEAIYNFDIGDEFELAMCRILRKALPSKYGVCRGHVITTDNQTAGDDIVIYDREGSPTLRMLPTGDFSRKEHIPIDAAYAYIEAKHTLYLDGTSNQSIAKAAKQVEAVKTLPREPRSHYKITDSLTLHRGLLDLEIGGLEHPEITNPLVGGIFSRYVAWNNKRQPPGELRNRPEIDFGIKPQLQPDIIVAGNDMVGLPVRTEVEGNEKSLLLFRSTTTPSQLHLWIAEGLALALGIICLLHALDTIQLNKIDWKPIIAEQLNRRQ